MKLVYNPGVNAVVYGADGLMVAPGEWAYLEADAKIHRALDDGGLVEVNVPTEMPTDVQAGAFAPLKAAVDDYQAQKAQAEADAKKAQKTEQVRNTGNSTRNKTNKEA